EEIYFPKVTKPNLVLVMSQEAAKKYVDDLSDAGVLVTDSLFVKDLPTSFKGKVYELPITHTAKTELGKALFANIIALGAIVKLTGLVTEASIIKAVLNRVPKGTEEVNEKAIKLGMSLIK
ncbi:MAG: 2-oxoacid:acceptor oxidoreductase family protein, partial [Acidaminococcaceae bacterium]|nr:2-oxoacid:acceptor oxidoreductase family protein [Acidaminococcaceae bacterium]